MDEKYIGSKLKYLRQQKNMRQSDLADALSVSMSTISHWEKSRRFPSVIEIKRIADFFEVDINVLLNPSYEDLADNKTMNTTYSVTLYIPKKVSGLQIYLGIALIFVALMWSSIFFGPLIAYATYGLSFVSSVLLLIVYAYFYVQHKKNTISKVSFSSKDSIIYQHEKDEPEVERSRHVFIFLSLFSLITLFMFFVLYIGLLLSMNRFIISPFIMTTLGIIVMGIRTFLHHLLSMKHPFVFACPHVEITSRMRKSAIGVSLAIDFLSITALLLFLLIYNIRFTEPLTPLVAIFGYVTLAIDLTFVYLHQVFVSGFKLVNKNTSQSIDLHDGQEEPL